MTPKREWPDVGYIFPPQAGETFRRETMNSNDHPGYVAVYLLRNTDSIWGLYTYIPRAKATSALIDEIHQMLEDLTAARTPSA